MTGISPRTVARNKTRRERLSSVANFRFDTLAELALAIGVSPSYVSQIMSGHRGIGDDMADKIEARLGLDFGCLDEADEGGK